MIPLGVIASSQAGTQSQVPTDVTQVQEWSVSSATGPATGPSTTAGSCLIARIVHRQGSSGRTVEVSDAAGNDWREIATVAAGGSGDLSMWYCENALPTTSVQALVGGAASTRYLFVVEWAGIALEDALVDFAALSNPSATGAHPAAKVQTEAPGALVVGSLGATVSNRSFDLTPASITAGYVPGIEHRGNQSTLISASLVGAPAGEHGPQWILSGSASTTGVITAAFRPAT